MYQSGLSLSKVAERMGVSVKCITNILKAYDITSRKPGDSIRLLYERVKFKPPKDFPWNLRKKFLKLISVLLLTDGYVNKKGRIKFICTDKILQRYFLTLFKNEFNVTSTPKSFMIKGKETTINSKDACLKLFRLSQTYNKYPYKCSIENYLKSPQPSLSFLRNESLRLLKECVRLAMSTEGSITVEFPRNTIYPKLEFSCANPKLCYYWKKIFNKVGIKSYIIYSKKTWSKIKGLKIANLKSIEKFIEIGGFIEGVKITRKSKFFAGIPKNDLLKLVYEMRRNSFTFPPNFTGIDKKRIIKSMLKNVLEKEKWWAICVEERAIKKDLEKRKNKVIEFFKLYIKNFQTEMKKMEIVWFIKELSESKVYPTWKDINEQFETWYTNYFGSIREIYYLANVVYPRKLKRKPKKPLKTREEGRKAIKEYIFKNIKRGVLPSRDEIEKNVRIRFASYFKSIDEAYEYFKIPFYRVSPFKRAFLLKPKGIKHETE
jgi:hypothetical protein